MDDHKTIEAWAVEKSKNAIYVWASTKGKDADLIESVALALMDVAKEYESCVNENEDRFSSIIQNLEDRNIDLQAKLSDAQELIKWNVDQHLRFKQDAENSQVKIERAKGHLAEFKQKGSQYSDYGRANFASEAIDAALNELNS